MVLENDLDGGKFLNKTFARYEVRRPYPESLAKTQVFLSVLEILQ